MRAAGHPRIGVWLFSDAPAAELVDAVVRAEEGGLDEVWIADEGVPREPLPVLCYAAARTQRIELGVGVTSPFLRHPGAIGSTLATLDELSSGRALLGIGVGGGLALDPFGLRADRPVAAVRDAIRIARGVIRREPCEGYEPPHHAGPARDLPIFVGARGEQLLRLASRDADGVFLSGFDLDALDAPVEWARSVRPVHVGLYASVQFRDGAPHNPTALTGTPQAVADGMRALADRHAPDTIGLALIDGTGPLQMIDQAIAAVAAFRSS
ncbi:MAG: LLM class flavin-dependent oxidoreductase [Ilumatobacteraceae bacterium]